MIFARCRRWEHRRGKGNDSDYQVVVLVSNKELAFRAADNCYFDDCSTSFILANLGYRGTQILAFDSRVRLTTQDKSTNAWTLVPNFGL